MKGGGWSCSAKTGTCSEDDEKDALLTHPTPARQDAPFPKLRSQSSVHLDIQKQYASASELPAALLAEILSSRTMQLTPTLLCSLTLDLSHVLLAFVSRQQEPRLNYLSCHH